MRLQQIDFLRGIAVLSVVCFHQPGIEYLNQIGWIGVDLFFVLSGFLVSSLIFKEYLTFGDFKPGLFLIRRGFKIYPAFYLFLALTFVLKLLTNEPRPLNLFLYEAVFLRNFLGGFWAHTWSLCVEEHFYFLLAGTSVLLAKRWFANQSRMNVLFFSILAVCLLLRILNVWAEQRFGQNALLNEWSRRVHTIYCLDSLCFGVMLAYQFAFNRTRFITWFQSIQKFIFIPAVLAAGILPLFMMKGYASCFLITLLNLSFGTILVAFLADEQPFEWINKGIFKPITSAIAHVGVYSYTVYLIHPMIRDYFLRLLPFQDKWLVFLIYFSASIGFGMLLYHVVEHYCIGIRDKYYPARVKPVDNLNAGGIRS
mgnify:CR=1 FL=1